MNAPTRAVWFAAAIAASACRSGPDYAPPELALPSGFAFADAAAFPPVVAAADWWTALQSRELDALVAAVDRDGLDLQVAGHRIAQARAAAGLAAAAAWPSVGAAAEFTRQRTTAATPSPVRGRAFDTVRAGFDVAWEIDLWGRVAREHEAAGAAVGVAEADFAAARSSLRAEVVVVWTELATVARRAAVLADSIAAAEQLLEIARAQATGGVGTELDLARAERLVAATRARAPELAQRRATAAYRLDVLLGRTPGGEPPPAATTPLPLVPDVVAIGLPAALVQQRPDVRAAERQLAAATARVGAALAARWPRLSLSGFFGFEADHGGDLGRWSSRALRTGPQVALPLFDGGARAAAVDEREAEVAEAAVRLRQQVLLAFEEVATATAALQQQRLQAAELRRALAAAERAQAFARERFAAGIDDFLAVLDAEQGRLDLADRIAVVDAECWRQFAALHKALGSGVGAPADRAGD